MTDVIIAIAVVIGVVAFFENRRLKKRFDILERMLQRKGVLTSDETKWASLPDEVRRDVTEMNKE